MLAQSLFVLLGQPAVVENRSGDGLVGTGAVATATPDRRIFAVTSAGAPAIAPEEFAAFIRAEAARWGEAARRSGATMD